MPTVFHAYRPESDFESIGRFLVDTYRTSGGHINWLQSRWEYMHFHPLFGEVDPGSIGVWEADGEIVGVSHPEHSMGTAYFEIHPDFGFLKGEMLAHAETRIRTTANGRKSLGVWLHDGDEEFQQIAESAGYERDGAAEPMSTLDPARLLEAVPLPDGFRLQSLADDNDLRKIDRVLWRGFDHGDDPPDDGIEGREFMQSAPNYRKDLNIVAVAPDGEFVSYCGMWYEPTHRTAYVEPVATDPDFRLMGLGKAAVVEGIRRCRSLGATVAYVGSTLPIYRSIGFRQVYSSSRWHREWG